MIYKPNQFTMAKSSQYNELKKLLMLALPTMLSQLLRFINPSISVMITNILGLSIDTGFSSACDTLFSQAYGSGNRKLMGKLLQRALCVVCLMYSGLVCIHLNIEKLLLLLGQDPLIASLSSEYITYFLPGLGFDFLFLTFGRYLQTQNIVQPMVYAALTGTVLNIFTQYYFVIQWNYGIRNWGVFFKLGIPGVLMVAFEEWCFEIMTLMAGTLGSITLGAQAIVFQIQSIIYMIPLGLFTAVNIRVGQELGAFNPTGARYVYVIALKIISVVALFTGLPVVLVRHYIPLMFTSDKEVCLLASQLMPMLLLFQFFEGFAGVSEAVLLACGRQCLGAIIIFLGYYCIGMPIAAVLTYQTSLGIFGSWIGLTVGFGLTTTTYTILALRTDWDEQVKRARKNVTEKLAVSSINNINGKYESNYLSIEDQNADGLYSSIFHQFNEISSITDNLLKCRETTHSKRIKWKSSYSKLVLFKCSIFVIFLILLGLSLYIRLMHSTPLWHTYCIQQVDSLNISSFCIRIMPVDTYPFKATTNMSYLLTDNTMI
ncbi:Multidrug and toxin extrusion protein 1 [Schistosoma japonicum]|nr:Multidrug and toxin extrusion protein 1 [Schistosoma japonicum]